MRLIDAEALKEKLDELEPYIDCDENSTTWILSDEVYNAVDSAPELSYEDGILLVENATRRAIELEEAYNNGWSDGFSECENERPQGEWKVKTKSTFPQYQPDEYLCPFCNTVVNYKTNFCHHCGADMRGDKNGDDE